MFRIAFRSCPLVSCYFFYFFLEKLGFSSEEQEAKKDNLVGETDEGAKSGNLVEAADEGAKSDNLVEEVDEGAKSDNLVEEADEGAKSNNLMEEADQEVVQKDRSTAKYSRGNLSLALAFLQLQST